MKLKRTTKYSRQVHEHNILVGKKQIKEQFDHYIIKLEKEKDKEKIKKTFTKIVKNIKTKYCIKNVTKPERIFIQDYNKLNNKLK